MYVPLYINPFSCNRTNASTTPALMFGSMVNLSLFQSALAPNARNCDVIAPPCSSLYLHALPRKSDLFTNASNFAILSSSLCIFTSDSMARISSSVPRRFPSADIIFSTCNCVAMPA